MATNPHMRGHDPILATGWFKLMAEIYSYSPANIHAIYSVQTVKLCTRLLCAVAETSPVVIFLVLFCFLPDFLSVHIFGKSRPPETKNFRREKKHTHNQTSKQPDVRPRDGNLKLVC